MKRYDTIVIPMLVQFPGERPRFLPPWEAALAEGWEPCGSSHEVEDSFEVPGKTAEEGEPATETATRMGRIVFGLLKRPASPVLLPSFQETRKHGSKGPH